MLQRVYLAVPCNVNRLDERVKNIDKVYKDGSCQLLIRRSMDRFSVELCICNNKIPGPNHAACHEKVNGNQFLFIIFLSLRANRSIFVYFICGLWQPSPSTYTLSMVQSLLIHLCILYQWLRIIVPANLISAINFLQSLPLSFTLLKQRLWRIHKYIQGHATIRRCRLGQL